MNRFFTFLLAFFLCSSQVFAQENLQTSGKLVDSIGNPIARASIRIYIEGGSDTLKTISNNVGFFLVKGIPSRKFNVLITSVGFGLDKRTYTIPDAEESIALGEIKLLPAYSSLQEIIVSVPPVIVKEDTVEYKADSFRLKPNAMVEDLLKKMPGIEVDKNGNITAQGKTVTKVRVNGKDFFSGDPKTATRELSADMIDKVQVIDDYGDLANASGIKDGEPDKVINLQLKKDKNKGFFGRSTIGAGTNERYQGTANMNFFSNNSQFSVFGGANNTNTSTFNFDGNNNGGGNNNYHQ